MQRWCRGAGTEDGTLLASVLCYQGACCVWFSIGVVQQRCMCRKLLELLELEEQEAGTLVQQRFEGAEFQR